MGKMLSLVPYPASVTKGDGSLSLSKIDGIVATGDAPLRYASEFASQAKRTLGIDLQVNPASAACAISMVADKTLEHEAYRLNINASGVEIASADSTGFFYGLQTLKQLLPAAIYGKTLQKTMDGRCLTWKSLTSPTSATAVSCSMWPATSSLRLK